MSELKLGFEEIDQISSSIDNLLEESQNLSLSHKKAANASSLFAVLALILAYVAQSQKFDTYLIAIALCLCLLIFIFSISFFLYASKLRKKVENFNQFVSIASEKIGLLRDFTIEFNEAVDEVESAGDEIKLLKTALSRISSTEERVEFESRMKSIDLIIDDKVNQMASFKERIPKIYSDLDDCLESAKLELKAYKELNVFKSKGFNLAT